ncbi:uncharacterized protein LOC142340843 [Convolutriloba macropyga]|uniref:uncharacterized protein LOC142340843 n=1 Tax=Convolutriloba macropyga TaxID=536237 RepID=UPI003F5257CF
MSENSTEMYDYIHSNLEWFELYPDIFFIIFLIEIIAIFISIFGCIGNIFIILIISQWENINSGATFMLILAVFDFLSASYVSIFNLALPLLNFHIRNFNNFLCAFSAFVSSFAIYTSYYLTVLFSLDKFVAVMFPFKYREFGKAKTGIYATLSVLMIQIAWAIPNVLVFRIEPYSQTCAAIHFDILTNQFFTVIYPNVNFFINGVIPVLFVFIFTFATIVKLRIQSKKRKNVRGNSMAGRRDSEMTRQMIVVCFLFGALCLVVTVCVQIVYEIFPRNAYDQAVLYFFFAVIMFCNCLINSVNFFIYMIYGKKFRANFIELFRSRA